MPFSQIKWNVKGVKQDFSNKVIILNVTSILIFQYKYDRKTSFKKYIIGIFQLLQRQVSEKNRWYVLLENKSCICHISCGKKGYTGRPKKFTQRIERNIIKTVCGSPQSSTRELALQVEKYLVVRVSHETIRNVLEKHKYSSRVTRKKTYSVSTRCKKDITICYRTGFTSSGVSYQYSLFR